jgi:hypothetical protein
MILAALLNVLEYRQNMFRFGWILSPADEQTGDRLLAVDAQRPFADVSLTHLNLCFETLHRISLQSDTSSHKGPFVTSPG